MLSVGDTVYVGRGARTNEEGICQLAHLLGGRKVVPVDTRGCLHLKSAMTALPDGGLIGMPDMVDTSVLPCMRVAPEPSGAHVVLLGPGHVLLASSAPRARPSWRRTACASRASTSASSRPSTAV